MYSSLLPRRTLTALEMYFRRVYKYDHPNVITRNGRLKRRSREGAQQKRGATKKVAVGPPPFPEAVKPVVVSPPAAVAAVGVELGDATEAAEAVQQQVMRPATLYNVQSEFSGSGLAPKAVPRLTPPASNAQGALHPSSVFLLASPGLTRSDFAMPPSSWFTSRHPWCNSSPHLPAPAGPRLIVCEPVPSPLHPRLRLFGHGSSRGGPGNDSD